jgi:hypothetical protein
VFIIFKFYLKCLYSWIGAMLHTMFMTCETYSHSILTLTRPLSMSVWGLLVAGGGGEAGTES